ncbi:alpha/beta fold hydrolase [Actinoplanes sp. NPDC049265]|uniref:alpha/beta fold hydrolase n=1 Tax=Actinoplanes sp. NPDC049265 TaxID=3363902 RepID=UPI00371427FB
MTKSKIIAAAVGVLVVLGLGYLNLPTRALEVPEGARPGSMTLRDCEYDTEAGRVPADCGTLVVPESRRDPKSDLIALPVIRVRATGPARREPIFRLGGGPGITNLTFPQANRLTTGHDLVLVGYRGVDGSRRLDCPEVAGSLRSSADLAAPKAQSLTAKAFWACAKRLTGDGVDLTSYSIVDRVEDLEAARTALGYQRINLLSSSAGTRTAMVYSWRHPTSLFRSAMVSVNPPGHFIWDPRITDSQIGQYTQLCRADSRCSARTPDLAASMREAATDIPERWGPLRVKGTNVRIEGMYGMHYNGPASGPVNAPTLIDAYLSAAEGDRSGFWAMSALGDVLLPDSIVWGEFASFAMIDAPAVKKYYEAGGDPGSILHNAGSEFLWGGPGGVATVWPDSPGNAEYRAMRPSDVETLLVGGTVDFSTPAELATRELLPSLPHGHQVVLGELGHTADFWEHRPEAGRHLLTTFYDTGAVDASHFDKRPVDFTPTPLSMPAIGKLLIGVTSGLALIAVLLLVILLRRRFRPRTGVLLRLLTPVPLGLGGWCLAALLVWIAWPGTYVGSASVAVPAVGLSVGLGAWAAWNRDDRDARTRRLGLIAAVGGALAGAILGFGAGAGITAPVIAVAGAATVTNLGLLAVRFRR